MTPRTRKSDTGTGKVAGVARLIEREIHTRANGRLLRSLPLFRSETELPDRMRDLLSQLEAAEKRSPVPGRR